MGRGAAPWADHRPGVRLDDAARRGPRGLRRRARSRALRAEHAGWRRPGARRAARGGGRRRLDASVRRAPGRHRRGWHQARPARGHPVRPGRSRPGDAAGARLRLPYQPGRGRSGGGERGHRRRAAGTAGRAGAAGGGAARPRPRRPGPALGGPVVQHPGQRHRRHRHAASRDDDRRPGAAAHPVPAARPDQGPGITERTGHIGHRRRARRGQPPRHPGRRPGARHGPDRGRPLDPDQAGGRPAIAASRDDAASRADPAHRLRPHAGPASPPWPAGRSGLRRSPG